MGLSHAKNILDLRVNGFCTFQSLFSEQELAPVSAATKKLIDNWHKSPGQDPDFWYWTPEGEDPILYRIHNLEKSKDQSILDIVNHPKLLEIVHAVFGCEVFPTAHALIVKMPDRGSDVPWHRDPVDVPPLSVFNFSIFLDDSNVENGCLQMVPASHFDRLNEVDDIERKNDSVYLPANKGDVTVHDVRVLHGSGSSASPFMRRSIVVEFTPRWVSDMRSEGLLTAPDHV